MTTLEWTLAVVCAVQGILLLCLTYEYYGAIKTLKLISDLLGEITGTFKSDRSKK